LTDRSALDALAGGFDALDVLVNNAGQNLPGGRSEWEPDVFEESLAINLSGAFRLAVACKPMLAKSSLAGGGSIVNLASMSSFFAVPVVPGYGAAKAGIVQMTKNLAVAWAGDGVRVNAVAPGLVESNMTAVMKGVEALEGPQLARTPLGRWGQPGEIAPAVLFLASSAASFVTGATLCVDGGYSAG
jgi:NAD(P)-dependent dehydrogenase (short-subunit alcohol dehydrogenase family)